MAEPQNKNNKGRSKKTIQKAWEAYHLNPLKGEKKGGGGGSAPELPNTLASRAIVKIGVLASEGPVQGPMGGAQGIYINETPLQNSDGTYNYKNIKYDWRVGTPGQSLITGFGEAPSIVDVGAVLTTTSDVIRETTEDDASSVKIIINLPTGLVFSWQGQLFPTWVDLKIYRRLSGTTAWEFVTDVQISGKTDSITQKQVRITRPDGVGKWQYRVQRVTADSNVSTLRNDTTIAQHVEYTPIQADNNYPDVAWFAVGVDAEAVNGQIPKISVLWKGLTVKVPSNYNTETRAYTGMWNGAFKNEWTDNPAWILYDLLTNERYGLGARGLLAADVNKWSFYDAGVYCDEMVPANEAHTEFEPRFRFNYPIASRDDAWKVLSSIAANMHATIYQDMRGQISLSQDRPADPKMLVTKANVISGEGTAPFNYKGTDLEERPTSIKVTFNDRLNMNLPRIITVESEEYIDLYGYNVSDIAAFGVVTEGQARRHGLWTLYTAHEQTDIVNFSMGLNGADLEPGDIVSIWDEDYTDKAGGGRIVSYATGTVTLDRDVEIGLGSSIRAMLADGITVESRSITNVPGTYRTVTVSPPFSQPLIDHADYIVVSSVEPRQFRVTSNIGDGKQYNIEAIAHNPNKYLLIEQGIDLPAPVYTDSEPSVCSAPQDLTARESVINDNGVLIRQALVSWVPPARGKAVSYLLDYRRVADVGGVDAGDSWVSVSVKGTSYSIPQVSTGRYEIQCRAVSVFGMASADFATAFLNIDTNGGESSPLLAPVGLQNAIDGSTTQFVGRDLVVKWQNPSDQSTALAALRDFQVTIIDADSNDVMRQDYVAGVPPGGFQQYTYTFSMNTNDGGPIRRLKVSVRCRDTSNNLSAAVERTFLNPAPAYVTGIEVTPAMGMVYIQLNRPTDADFAGVAIWRGSSAGFTPSPSTLVFRGDSIFFTDNAVEPGTTYYYKVAAFDDFGFADDASDLNLSASFSATPLQFEVGVPGGTTFPTSAEEGDTFYRTDLKTLYIYTSGAWVAAGVATGTALPSTAQEGDTFILTPDNVMYIRKSGAWQAITPADGSITTGKLAAGAVTTAKLAAGAVTANEIAASTITGGNIAGNTIEGTNIAGNTITGNKIVGSTITGDKIQGATITGDKIAGNTIEGTNIKGTTITGDKIVGGTITGDKIAAGSIDTSLLKVAASNNSVPDSEMAYGNGGTLTRSGWLPKGWGTFQTHDVAPVFGINYPDLSWNPSGSNSMAIYQPNNSYNGNQDWSVYQQIYSPPIAVVAGRRYEFSVYTGAHRAMNGCHIEFYNASDAGLGSINGTVNNVEAAGGKALSGYKRIGGFAYAPSGTAYARLCVKKAPTITGNSNSYAFFTKPYLGEAYANQTEFTPYTPNGGGTLIDANGITTNSLSALSANAGTLSAGQITINSNNAGDWGYIRTPGKWLDGNWGWIMAQHPNGSMFFDLTMSNFRLWAHHNAGVSASWGLDAPGISMGPGGLTVSQANVINTLQIAGNAVTIPAAATMSTGPVYNSSAWASNPRAVFYNYDGQGSPILIWCLFRTSNNDHIDVYVYRGGSLLASGAAGAATCFAIQPPAGGGDIFVTTGSSSGGAISLLSGSVILMTVKR